MAPKVKEAMGVISDAFETACGYAFCAVALYVLLFVNMTGNGTLWDSMRGVFMDISVQIPKDAAVQTRLVPARPRDAMTKAQNRMLLIPDEPEKEFSVPVLAQQQPVRAADQISDTLVGAKAGKDSRRRLAAGGAPETSRVRVPATPATAASAYRAGIAAETRPGVVDHVLQVDDGVGSYVRN